MEVSLVRAVLTSEIKADESLKYVYDSGPRVYDHDMLVVNVKTILKKGDVKANYAVEEQLALDISYV